MKQPLFIACLLLLLVACRDDSFVVPTLLPTAAVPTAVSSSPINNNDNPTDSNRLVRTGNTIRSQGTLPDNGLTTYIITNTANSLVDIYVDNPAIQVTLVDVSNNQAIAESVNGRWIGTLPTDSDYYLHIDSIFFGLDYQLLVNYPTLVTALPTTLTGQLPRTGQDSYIFAGNAEQQLTIETDGDVTFWLVGEDGTTLIDASSATETWSGTLPTAQRYTIYLIGDDFASYTVSIE